MAKPSLRFNNEPSSRRNAGSAGPALSVHAAPLRSARSFLLIFSALLCVLGLQFLTTPPAPDPLAVVSLHWNAPTGKGFIDGSASQVPEQQSLLGVNSSVVFDPEYASSHTRSIVSDHIAARGARIEFEISGNFSDVSLPVPKIELLDARGKQVFEYALPLRTSAPAPGGWKSYGFQLPESIKRDDRIAFRLKIPPRPGMSDSLAIRGRVVFTQVPTFRGALVENLNKRPLLGALIIGTLAALLFLTLSPFLLQYSRATSSRGLFLLFLLVCFAVHFRSTAYFHWDDWHVLKRFQDLGLRGVIYRHNEHFLPLFFAAYFAEAKIFGDNYFFFVAVVLLLHAANSVLVFKIFDVLFLGNATLKPVAAILGLGYAVSSLHSETLHWAFETSLLLSETLTLFSIFYVLSAGATGATGATSATGATGAGGFNRRRSATLFALSATCPLLFGNGFMLPAVIGAFSLYRHWSERLRASRFHVTPIVKPVFFDATAAAAGAALSVCVYLLFTDGAGHGVEKASVLGNFKESLKYLVVGTQAGTVVRGLGLFPHLGLIIHEYLPAIFLKSPARPELVLAYCGAALSVCLLFLGNFRKNWPLWLLGQFFLFVYLLLPAIGRWQLGLHQSLALRYHSQMVFGLLLVLAPVLARYYGRTVLALCLVWLSVQTVMCVQFTYYSDRGRDVRRAFQEARLGGTGELAAGTPDPISPALTIREILSIRSWLDR